jgi:hypothetical protein
MPKVWPKSRPACKSANVRDRPRTPTHPPPQPRPRQAQAWGVVEE